MTKGHPCGVSLAAGGHASQTYAKPPRDTFPSLDLGRSRAMRWERARGQDRAGSSGHSCQHKGHGGTARWRCTEQPSAAEHVTRPLTPALLTHTADDLTLLAAVGSLGAS